MADLRLVEERKAPSAVTIGALVILGQAICQSDHEPRAWDVISGRLSSADLPAEEHSDVLDAVAALAERRSPISTASVCSQLLASGIAPSRYAPVISAAIDHAFPRLSVASLESICRQLRQEARARRAAAATREIGRLAASGAHPDEIAAQMSQEAARIACDVDPADDGAVNELGALDDAAEELLTASTRDRSILRSGLHDLDEIFPTGLRAGTLTIVAALTSRGKSSLALQIADALAGHLADSQDRGMVRLVSLEMSAQEIHKRRLIAESGISSGEWEHGPRAEAPTILHKAQTRLLARQLGVTYGGSLTVDEVLALARRDNARQGLRLLVVDYLQALEVKGSEETREREVARMARGLKGLALDLNVPVLALAQLSRAADQRDEPRLSDLRESGTIEQYADNVLLLYAVRKDEPGVITARIAKQRNGPRDLTCKLWFDGPLFRFRDLALSMAGGAR